MDISRIRGRLRSRRTLAIAALGVVLLLLGTASISSAQQGGHAKRVEFEDVLKMSDADRGAFDANVVSQLEAMVAP